MSDTINPPAELIGGPTASPFGQKTHPIFRLTFGGADVTEQVESRLLSLTVTDNAGSESDSFVLRLDDRLPHIPMPNAGEEVEIELGYQDFGLVLLGRFYMDEVEFSIDPAAEMTLRGESVNLLSTIKTLRSDAYDNMTIEAIVNKIAARNNLTPVVSPELAGILVDHRDQMNRSDMGFLTDLATQYSAVFKVEMDQAIFALAGRDVSVSGLRITDLTIHPGENVLGLRVLHQHRGRYSRLAARFHDYNAGETFTQDWPGMPDGNGAERTLNRRFGNEAEANAAAASESRRLSATSAKLTLNLVGEPNLSAEGKVTLSGFRDGIDGTWKIKTVTHEFTNDGLKTTVDAEVPSDPTANLDPNAQPVDLNDWSAGPDAP